MVLLLITPLAISLKMTLFPGKFPFVSSSSEIPQGDDVLRQSNPLLLTPSSPAASESDTSDVETLIAEATGAVRKKRRPRRGDDFNLLEALTKADF